MNSIDTLPQIVVFLGAGASAVAGYQTFAGFPDLIFSDEIRYQQLLGQLHSTTRPLLKDIEQSLRISNEATTHDNFLKRLDDYTKLWHVLRVDDVLRSRFLKSTIQWSEFAYFARTVEDAIRDLTDTTVRHYSANKVRTSGQPNEPGSDLMHCLFNFYCDLATRNNTPYLPIFTTNYDLLFEDLFEEFGHRSKPDFTLVNGFAGCTKEEGLWSKKEYQSHLRGIHLYRLHGCVSWFWKSDGEDKKILQYCRSEMPENPAADLCAIYPGYESLRGSDPHAYGFRKLNEMLLHCKLIIFIGFSFRDNDVMHVLLSANAEREQPLKLIVVDPTLNNTTVDKRLEAAGLQTQYPIRKPEACDIHCINLRYGFDNYSQIISDVVDQTLKG